MQEIKEKPSLSERLKQMKSQIQEKKPASKPEIKHQKLDAVIKNKPKTQTKNYQADYSKLKLLSADDYKLQTTSQDQVTQQQLTSYTPSQLVFEQTDQQRGPSPLSQTLSSQLVKQIKTRDAKSEEKK